MNFKRDYVPPFPRIAQSIFDADDFNCFTAPDELGETQRLMMRQMRSRDDAWQQHANGAFPRDH
jgi:hypothetical protein